VCSFKGEIQFLYSYVVLVVGVWVSQASNSNLNTREMAIIDAVNFEDIKIRHIPGKRNPADLFTKEHKDKEHFYPLRSLMVRPRRYGGVKHPMMVASRRLRVMSPESRR
jgi:hypothetical protein